MCGRINVSDHAGVQSLLEFLEMPLYPQTRFIARYNIAPGANLNSIFVGEKNYSLASMHWGIVPSWANPETFSRPLINARAETVWEKPSFRKLIQSQRVIIPVNGFYEWKKEKSHKKAFHIDSPDQSVLALGGLFQISNEGEMQCCIVTTEANETMSSIHHRMPVIVEKESISDWLRSEDKIVLNNLMTPCPNSWIKTTQVSSFVNNATHDGVECIKPESVSDSDSSDKMSADLFGYDD